MSVKTSESAELKKEMISEFWDHANRITTFQGVEMDLHNDKQVTASVLLRNHEEYEERIQVKAEFETVEAFIEVMAINSADELADITIADLLDLYKQGKAEITEQ